MKKVSSLATKQSRNFVQGRIRCCLCAVMFEGQNRGRQLHPAHPSQSSRRVGHPLLWFVAEWKG